MKKLVILFLLLIPLVYSADIVGYKPIENVILEELPYNVSLSLENSTIIQEDYLRANIQVIYFNDSQKRQYIVDYTIKNDKGMVAKDTRTVVIEKEIDLKKEFYIPKTVNPGKYEFSVEVKYLNYTALVSKEFYVSEKIEKYYYLNYILYGIILVSILVILFIIIFERNKLKNIEKNHPKELKKIYDEYKKEKKREDTLKKLAKQLRLLNEARELRVISKESHKKAVNSIESLIERIKK